MKQFSKGAVITGAVLSGSALATSETAIAAAAVSSGIELVHDTVQTPVNTPITIDVLANDRGVHIGENQVLSVQSLETAYGSLVHNEDNTLTYTPFEDHPGYDGFDYMVTETVGETGAEKIHMAWVAVTVYGDPVSSPSLEPTPTPTPTPTPILESTLTPLPESTPAPVTSLDLTKHVAKGNNVNTAKALMALCEPGSDGRQGACEQLLSLDPETDTNIDEIVRGISAEELLSQRRVSSELGRSKANRMYQSISYLRAGQGAHSLGYNGRTLRYGGAAGDGMSSPWSMLSSVFMRSSSYSKTQNEAAFEADAAGAMFGVSYRVSRSLFWGVALDWSQYSLDFDDSLGEIEADQYGLTGFFSWHLGALGFGGQIGYGAYGADISREVTFPASVNVNSDNSGNKFDSSIQAEWDFGWNAWRFRPYMRLDYMDFTINSFKEEGSTSWAVEVDEQSVTELNTSLGFSTQYASSFGWGVWVPELKFSLIQKSSMDDSELSFRFASSSSDERFILDADENEEFFYEWQVNSVFVFKNGISTFLSGSTVAGYENMDGFELSAGLNIEF